MVNLFDQARGKVKAEPAKKKAGKKKPEHEISGLSDYCALIAVSKAIEALADTLKEDVTDKMTDVFVKEGSALKRRPANFRGIEGDVGSASCELRKRTSRATLSDADVELLEQHGIDFDTVEDVVETFVINPAYAADQDTLAKVSAALTKIKGLPADFIILQEGKQRRVVSEASVDGVFALGNQRLVRQLISIVATLAVKPTYKGTLEAAIAQISPLLQPTEEEGEDA
jgi:hypothetical protein